MIYFMQDSGSLNVKIGFTASVGAEARRRQLQTGNPSRLVVLATMSGTEQDEGRLHKQFDAHCVGGEWFRPAPEILSLIASVSATKAPPPRLHFQPLRFYLAGKMDAGRISRGGRGWRGHVFEPNWDDEDLELDCDVPSVCPILLGTVLGDHDYVGPYFVDDFGCGGHYSGGDPGTHGLFSLSNALMLPSEEGDPITTPEQAAALRVKIRELCLAGIRKADVVFCWLTSTDCYGTLAEIGYAHAIGRRIWIASPSPLPDLWFPLGMAEWHGSRFATPDAALRAALSWLFRTRLDESPTLAREREALP